MKKRVSCFFITVIEGSLVTFPVHCLDLPVAKRTILQLNIPHFCHLSVQNKGNSYLLLKQVQLDVFLGIIKKGMG